MKAEDLMQRCLEIAKIALENGDAPVGSLIVIDKEIVAEGIEGVRQSKDPTAHAEMLAVRASCEKLQSLDLSAATLFTNVEPCMMCAFAIRQTGINRVVFASPNKKVGAVNFKFPILTTSDFSLKFPPPLVESGVLQIESESLM